jgi:hypothetical protein
MNGSLDKNYLLPRLGNMVQLASVRRLVAEDGKGRGMRILEFDNGSGLRFTVYPDRGMDIGQATYKGTPLAWMSCNGDVAPQFYDAEGFEWLRTWPGGLLTGCGLTNVGGPNDAPGGPHGLHGRISHTPAQEVNAGAAWLDDHTYELSATGHVCQSKVFGERLALTRRISTRLGAAAIEVRDTIENLGFSPSPLMLVYHCNFGWPLIDAGTILEAADHNVTPQTPHAAAGMSDWAKVTEPVPGFNEQVYYHDVPAASDGLASMRMVNRGLGIAVRVSYRTAELPYLIEWKMMGQGEYVMGIEPGNCYPEGQEKVAKRGLLRQLNPGERIETLVRLTVEELR